MPPFAFVLAYVALDWASYIEPLFGLNVTPWNPPPALGFVYWLTHGKATAPYWFLALLISELVARDLPEGLPLAIVLSALLAIGYGLTAEALRHYFPSGEIFHNRRGLLTWVVIIVVGTFANGLAYISLLYFTGLIPPGEWFTAFSQFWVGDMVGVIVSMPFIWLLFDTRNRMRLYELLVQWETVAYLALTIIILWLVFGFGAASEYKHYYFLILPLGWAAARQGMAGAGLLGFILQLCVVAIVEWLKAIDVSVFELQLLGAVLALVAFFIGVVVDEQRQAADELRHTLRLAAAGDMASALAHELNQPMTALSAYGKACEHLLERGETGDTLRNAIHRMVAEASRAADVVRRLRDFFRTGAIRLESVELGALVAAASGNFRKDAHKKDVQLVVDPAPAVPILVDRLQIQVVLRNLLANAFESVSAMPVGKRRVTLSTVILTGKRIRVTVEDSGPGISGKIRGRLFEPFVSSKSSGLGLGLVISRAIVEAHGGSLWAEIGDHGIFTFELPLAGSLDDVT
jgi:two-component system sensor kinase FixL